MKKNSKQQVGAVGFSREYWDVNYAEPEEMDNIINAREHAAYMKAIFSLEAVDISSVIDLGFGLGILFEEVLKTFIPYRACGLEPSKHAFDLVSKRDIRPAESTKLLMLNTDLSTWAQTELKKDKIFDLGICTSVLQYLSDEEILLVLPVLAARVRYLYLSVPTDLELKHQIEEVKFKDEYAIHRSREKYLKFFRPHFTFISSRLLESKIHHETDNSSFTDLLFRF
jgi:hypothetical protein